MIAYACSKSPLFSRPIRLVVLTAMLCLLIAGRSAFAQTGATVSGTVVDQLGGAVSGAAAMLLSDGRAVGQTTTDTTGHFTFADVAAGRYEVEVHAAGFLSRVIDPFFVGANARVSLQVTLSIGLAQEVAVTAAAIELPASQVAASVTVIDHTTIEAEGKPSVSEALRLVPGVAVTQTGGAGGTTSLFVRGGASNFNKVLIDGVPANEVGGAFDFEDLATTGVDRIEVLRDANSVLYGSDALAGVVDITTRRGRSRIPELSYTIDGGNLSTGQHQLSFGGARRRVDYFAAFSNFSTDNNVANNKYRNRTFAGRLGWAVGAHTDVSTVVRAGDYRSGNPNATDYYGLVDDSLRTGNEKLLSVTAESAISPRWRSTIRFAVADRLTHFDNPSPTGEPFDPFGFGANFLGKNVTITGANGYSVTGQAILDFGGTFPQPFDQGTNRKVLLAETTYHATDAIDVSGGVRIEHETGFSDSGQRTTTTRDNWGAFVEGRGTWGRVMTTAGLGVDDNAIFGTAVTPRVSVSAYLRPASSTAELGDTKVFLNAGTGIKAPDIGQEQSSLYAVLGAPAAGNVGVQPIGPERGKSFDVGIEQGLWQGRVRTRATVFDNTFTDLIEFVSKSVLPELGVSPDAAAELAFGADVNSSSYRAKGVELSAQAGFGDVSVLGSYTFLDAVVTKSLSGGVLAPAVNPAFPDIPIGQYAALVGARPFRRPANVGSFLVRYAKGPAQVSLAGYLSGKQDDSTFLTDGFFGDSMLLPNRDLTPRFQKVDLSGSYRIGRRLRWSLSVENLLNEKYEQAAGFPALPLTFRTGITITAGGDAPRRP